MQRPRRPRFTLFADLYRHRGELQAQRLLGSAAHILHGQRLSPATGSTLSGSHPDYPFLAASDLGNEIERVKLTPQPFSLENCQNYGRFFPDDLPVVDGVRRIGCFVEAQDPTSRAFACLDAGGDCTAIGRQLPRSPDFDIAIWRCGCAAISG